MFWPERLRAAAGEERAAAAATNPESLDLLVWNVFATLETHADPDWLAYRLQMLGGTSVTAPIRLGLWAGRSNEPLLRPSREYVAAVRAKAEAAGGGAAALAAFTAPVEVPVLVESPAVIALVDATVGPYPRGAGGRDRILELVDVGVEHAQRLGKQLAVGVVYVSGSRSAGELSARLNDLRGKGALAEALPHADPRALDRVLLREVSWQQLLRTWQAETSYLDLPSSPSPKAFLAHCKDRGLL